MSLPGWIVVHGGAAFDFAGARVLAGGVAAGIGQSIAVPPGFVTVAIEVPIRFECVALDARLDVAVFVTSGRTTEIELPTARILERAD